MFGLYYYSVIASPSPALRNRRRPRARTQSGKSHNEDDSTHINRPHTNSVPVMPHSGQSSPTPSAASHGYVNRPIAIVNAQEGSSIPAATATASTHSPNLSVTVVSRNRGQKTPRQPPSVSDTSDDSCLDSLEEGRAPLLRNEDNDDDESYNRYDGDGIEHLPPTDYETTDQAALKNARRRIPRERLKAAIAVTMLVVCAMFNDLVLSFIHEKVPETSPLPDIVFENIPYWQGALSLSEYLMLSSFSALMVLTFCHKHRWVVLRRIAIIGALLYGLRCITMFVTQVPVADRNYQCSKKFSPEDRTIWNILMRGLRVLSGLGLNVKGKYVLCGDYIYSGHTIVHVTCYLFIKEYTPRRWWPAHYLSLIFSTVGVICLLVSRGHYTIDVVLAYWITTRIFWTYHTLCDNQLLRTQQQGRNHFVKEFWYPLFRFMEGNVVRPIPRRYGLPSPLKNLVTNIQRNTIHNNGGGDRIR
ncbi:phosphatidylcholine:ceramide cholinephosphotransferase 1 [Ditylenchus destructor]|nr:phosphatidylcholine:ceramide cholinephosphotransferase 1 [Ditylenchus destructor]